LIAWVCFLIGSLMQLHQTEHATAFHDACRLRQPLRRSAQGADRSPWRKPVATTGPLPTVT